MFPAAAEPSSQWNSVYCASGPSVPQPVDDHRVGVRRRVDRLTSSADVPLPLAPTCVAAAEDVQVEVVRAVREVVEQREARVRRARRDVDSC